VPDVRLADSGPANLVTFPKALPPFWTNTYRTILYKRVGDLDDRAVAEQFRAASPLFSADRIKIPLLIGQGSNDVRVAQAEAEQMVEAIARPGGRPTYVASRPAAIAPRQTRRAMSGRASGLQVAKGLGAILRTNRRALISSLHRRAAPCQPLVSRHRSRR
jgi:hypothetical protein